MCTRNNLFITYVCSAVVSTVMHFFREKVVRQSNHVLLREKERFLTYFFGIGMYSNLSELIKYKKYTHTTKRTT